MNDPLPRPTDDDPLPGRLAAWFDGEVRRAEADLRATPLGTARPGPARVRARGAAMGPIAAALLVVVVVAAGLSRLPGAAPGSSPSGASSPTATLPASPSTAPPVATTDTAPVVDSRYPDGIPSSLGGRFVARPSNIDREPANDQSFLLGGWSFGPLVYFCPLQIGTPPPFGPGCGTPFIAENPLIDGQGVMIDGLTLGAGPVVVEVHRHDPQAAECDAALRVACENMAVVEKVVWNGDQVTATAPLAATDTFTRLIQADPNLPQARIAPIPTAGVVTPPAHFPAFVGCVPPYPELAWSATGASIEEVLVFPTVAAREAVDQNFLASGFIGTTPGGGGCNVISDGMFATSWVAVDNVMVAVQMNPDGPTAAQADLIDAIRAALTAP